MAALALRAAAVVARLPHPRQLRVVAAAAPLVHWKLGARAQPRPVLVAPRQRLVPRRAVQAATHAF